ncbi:MAG: hypothetical protein IAE77_22205 [Prosthecobacter sp.]|jgi:hypothetical protein|uniref:hypothetical protein n=1 Tax=Prosthecobacter sp. TaxID=1965333 RepID=UPI0019F42E8C|nr:hypothetical protein [Prosthecobacter sp.]MBE2286186.1 hypothetical protein [Prosthecobacter sp.]
MKEFALLVWGVLFGGGFWLIGALAIGIASTVFKEVQWWQRPLWLLFLIPFGAGGLFGLPIACLYGAWNTSSAGADDDWLWLGFWFWPMALCAAWLLSRRKK